MESFVEIHGGGDGTAGEVHEVWGLSSSVFFAGDDDVGHEAFVGDAKIRSAVFWGEEVDRHEARVVARAFVLGSRDSEADDEFHGGGRSM